MTEKIPPLKLVFSTICFYCFFLFFFLLPESTLLIPLIFLSWPSEIISSSKSLWAQRNYVTPRSRLKLLFSTALKFQYFIVSLCNPSSHFVNIYLLLHFCQSDLFFWVCDWFFDCWIIPYKIFSLNFSINRFTLFS